MQDFIFNFQNSDPSESLRWIDYLSAIGPIAISLAVAYIAFQQFRLNQKTFKRDVYELRLAVYREIKSFLSKIDSCGPPTLSEVWEFSVKTSEAEFLFGEEVKSKIEEIHAKSAKLSLNISKVSYADGRPKEIEEKERMKLADENEKIDIWLNVELENLSALFKPYFFLD